MSFFPWIANWRTLGNLHATRAFSVTESDFSTLNEIENLRKSYLNLKDSFLSEKISHDDYIDGITNIIDKILESLLDKWAKNPELELKIRDIVSSWLINNIIEGEDIKIDKNSEKLTLQTRYKPGSNIVFTRKDGYIFIDGEPVDNTPYKISLEYEPPDKNGNLIKDTIVLKINTDISGILSSYDVAYEQYGSDGDLYWHTEYHSSENPDVFNISYDNMTNITTAMFNIKDKIPYNIERISFGATRKPYNDFIVEGTINKDIIFNNVPPCPINPVDNIINNMYIIGAGTNLIAHTPIDGEYHEFLDILVNSDVRIINPIYFISVRDIENNEVRFYGEEIKLNYAKKPSGAIYSVFSLDLNIYGLPSTEIYTSATFTVYYLDKNNSRIDVVLLPLMINRNYIIPNPEPEPFKKPLSPLIIGGENKWSMPQI